MMVTPLSSIGTGKVADVTETDTPGADDAARPEPFRAAVAALTATRLRREVRVQPLRPPQRLAPYSYAVSADVIGSDGEELATGRLVLLHDPDGVEAWDGVLRLVGFASAELDHEMGVDEMLPAVGWSWLVGALEERGAAFLPRAARSPRRPRAGSATWPARRPRSPSSCAPAGRPTPPSWGRTCGRSPTCCAPPPDCHPRAWRCCRTPDVTDCEPEPAPLLGEPADGVPDPVETPEGLAEVVAAMAAASGPVAVDAERASGYRYSQRAYLVQLRREGAGTALVDPVALPGLGGLNAAIDGAEWILHAANQDLPCLAEVGLAPQRLFDTELAGRLLGEERVALGTMVEQHLGVRLEKGHSAADWSTRPLPHDWLVYAALDVELLIALREVLVEALRAEGKLDWAEQEFEAVRLAPPAPPRADPWRRTSGIHTLRNRRQLAVVRELWLARDEYAAQRDVAPGRVLPDAAIVDAARSLPRRPDDLAALRIYGGPRQRRQLSRWFGAVATALALPDAELPPVTGGAGDGIPPASRWRDRDPVAAQRLARCREVVSGLAERHRVLGQNLLASDLVRRIAWQPPVPTDEAAVREWLADHGARAWQIELTAVGLAEALAG